MAAELDESSKVSLGWKATYGAGAGLWNAGNTCYANAALQCLTYTAPLANYVLALEGSTTCAGPRICTLCVMRRHIIRALRHSGHVIQPPKALLVDFHRGRQEDAHEFLMVLVDAMQKVELHSEGSGVVHQIFGGSWRSQIKCLGCGSTSNTIDPYLDISLDIQAAQSVEQALTQCVEPEELSGANAYHCGVCLQKTPASKTLSVHVPAKVLIFLLKRFSDFTGEKITKHVQYSEWLDMRPYMSELNGAPLWYTLYAVLVHVGWTSRSGHYLAYVKPGDGHWYRMNDDEVTACDRSAALSQEAYVLFYIQNPNPEAGWNSGSAALEEETLGPEDQDCGANTRDLQAESRREDGKLEEQAQESQFEESTLDEWRRHVPEQIQPKETPLNLRKVEADLPANAVIIHPSRYRGELTKTHPEQENFCPNASTRNIAVLGASSTDQAPRLAGRARAAKKKNKNKNKQPQRRTVLVM